MGSEIGENKGEEATLDWDSTADEELRSIEESYYASSNSKRKTTSSSSPILDLDLHQQRRRSKGRRLPNWANCSADSVSYNRSWALSPPPCRFNSKMKYPRMVFEGRIVYCKTAIEAEQAALDLYDEIKARKQNEDRISFGFDIEWRPTFKKGEAPRKAALMQICVDPSNCYLFHIIHSGIPPILKSLLEDCSTVKVGVWIANDAMKISRDYNVIVESLDDLSEYANLKLGGPPKRWSLSSLTEMLTCKEVTHQLFCSKLDQTVDDGALGVCPPLVASVGIFYFGLWTWDIRWIWVTCLHYMFNAQLMYYFCLCFD